MGTYNFAPSDGSSTGLKIFTVDFMETVGKCKIYKPKGFEDYMSTVFTKPKLYEEAKLIKGIVYKKIKVILKVIMAITVIFGIVYPCNEESLLHSGHNTAHEYINNSTKTAPKYYITLVKNKFEYLVNESLWWYGELNDYYRFLKDNKISYEIYVKENSIDNITEYYFIFINTYDRVESVCIYGEDEVIHNGFSGGRIFDYGEDYDFAVEYYRNLGYKKIASGEMSINGLDKVNYPLYLPMTKEKQELLNQAHSYILDYFEKYNLKKYYIRDFDLHNGFYVLTEDENGFYEYVVTLYEGRFGISKPFYLSEDSIWNDYINKFIEHAIICYKY